MPPDDHRLPRSSPSTVSLNSITGLRSSSSVPTELPQEIIPDPDVSGILLADACPHCESSTTFIVEYLGRTTPLYACEDCGIVGRFIPQHER